MELATDAIGLERRFGSVVAVNIGTLQDFAQRAIPGLDYRTFELPTAIIFAVTGVSRAHAVVTDIQSEYFDRLLMSPVRRLPLVLGMMAADFVQIIILSVPVILLGMLVGVRFDTGLLGLLIFLLISGFWGLALTGFSCAMALKTASAGMVNATFMLFLPFVFLTTPTLPLEALTGWMATIARFNPMAYLLAGLRPPSTGAGSRRCSCRLRERSCSLASSASGWHRPRCEDP